MKCLRRYFCVLLCLLLSLGVFSVGVSAQEIGSQYSITQKIHYPENTFRKSLTFIPYDYNEEKYENIVTFANALPSGAFKYYYRISDPDGAVLFYGGRKVTAKLNNVYYSLLYEDFFNGELLTQKYVTAPTSVKAQIFYDDGTQAVTNATFTKRADKNINLSVEFTPSKDVIAIDFITYYDNLDIFLNGGGTKSGHTYDITYYLGEFNGADKYQYTFEVSSEEAGLLSGIIGWLTNIFDSITSFFSNMIESISNLTDTIISWFEDLVNSIIELPSKLWQLISDGLKALFVPSEEYIVGFKEDINELLAEKLGAVYQVIDITFESWDEITASDKANSINIPLVSIDLPDNTIFSFGGYKVQIVPNGFDFLVNSIKSIVGILCTILFINGLRKRYDEVMGVEI